VSSRRLLAVSAGCGLAAALLAYAWLAGQERALRDRTVPASVLVTVRHVPAGARLETSALAVREIPRAYVQPGALASPGEAVGQRTLAPLAAGEQVLANKLARDGVALAFSVPPGKRAVAVGVDTSAGVAGLLKPGDLVDVFVSTDAPGGPRTAVLIQGAPVLAVGRAFSAAPRDEAAPAPLFEEAAGTVTLAVSPYEAQQLAHLEVAGRIKLALRPPGDAERIPLPALAGTGTKAAAGGEDEPVRRR
jgi:pilus assembly protein CpaB